MADVGRVATNLSQLQQNPTVRARGKAGVGVFYNSAKLDASVTFIIENWGLILLACVSGGLLLWPALAQSGMRQLDTLAATRLINDGAVVIDVREPAEFSAGHLPHAKHIPVGDLDKRAGDLPANRPVLVVCASGQRSGRAASLLRKAGRDQVFCLEGGLGAWRQAGLPIVK
jgi:rhodanese-related sulfurtransferase